MIRLDTFGGAVLFGEDGARLLGAASQRRILALLSVLAASGEGGLTRDKLVGILWPDSAPKRARHSLTQTMYAARKALACDDLFEATEDVRLNPARIASDVAEFETAFRGGEDAVAVGLYRGPFLDGFYLSSSEFDWWLHHQRTRLEDEACAALHRLGARAEETADWDGAVTHLRRLAAIRSSDSGVAVRLMRALSAAGDRAGAVQHAAMHARLLREQYDMEPEAEVVALAAELREQPRPSEPALSEAAGTAGRGDAAPPAKARWRVRRRAPARAAGNSVPPPGADTVSADVHATEAAAAWRAMPGPLGVRSPWRRVLLTASARLALPIVRRMPPRVLQLAGGILLLLLVAGVFLRLAHRNEKPVAYRSLSQQVVVTPFRVAGADDALAYLRDGMVEMLSTRLADDTAARSVDAGAVLAAWRQAGITRTADVPRDSVVRLAAKLGAKRVVVGSVVGSPARMIVSASVLAVPSGQLSGEATVEGPADDLAVLVDQLAAKLLLVEAGQSDRLAEHLTHSLPALRAYLAGTAANAHGDYALSTRHYARALDYDSTFALAALHLAISAARLNDFELERQALYRAWSFRQELSDRDQGHLRALAGPRYPAPSNAAQAIAAWEEAATLAPNRAEVWFGLARRILADGAAAGLGDIRDRALAALQHASSLDHNDAGSRLLLARIGGEPAGRLGAHADAKSLPLSLFFRWWDAARRADRAELARVADSLPMAGPSNLREIAVAAEFDALRPADAARALDILASRALDSEQSLGILLAQHSLAMQRGQPAAALEITGRIQRLGPASRAHLRLRVLDAIFGEGERAAATAAAQELQRTAASVDLPNAGADACALAQWQVGQLDTAAARITLELLERSAADDAPTFVGAPPHACAALLRAQLAVVTTSPDARARLESVDSLVLTATTMGDLATYAPLAISRLYRRLGEPQRALAAIRRRPYLAAVWPRYLASALREEGDLSRETGDVAGAAAAYRQYLALRPDPETPLQPEVQAVRALVPPLGHP